MEFLKLCLFSEIQLNKYVYWTPTKCRSLYWAFSELQIRKKISSSYPWTGHNLLKRLSVLVSFSCNYSCCTYFEHLLRVTPRPQHWGYSTEHIWKGSCPCEFTSWNGKDRKKKRVVTNEIRRSRQIVTRARKKMNRVMFIMTEMHYGPVGPDITVPSCF